MVKIISLREEKHISADKEKKVRVNHEIRVPEVRLIGEDGNQVGVVTIQAALQRAEAVGMDLVEISPGVVPPVCRIMNIGKFRFEQNKKRAAQKKKQKQTHIKEMKFRPTTEVGDYQVKLRKIEEFLVAGDKVKITIRFRGREMQYQDLGVQLGQRIAGDLQNLAAMEQLPRLEGRQLVMLVGPKKKT